MATNYNIQYNTPRVQVQSPGRQNRLTDGDFKITPSMTEPVIFSFGNQDGVPLILTGFRLQFVVWEHSPTEHQTINLSQSSVILNKLIIIDDPHSGNANLLLSEQDTLLIGNHGMGQNLYWSLFMINEEEQVFPMQVSQLGGRYGSIKIDQAGMMPIAELIRNPTS